MFLRKESVCVLVLLSLLILLLGCCAVNADFLVAWRDTYRVSRHDNDWKNVGDFATFPSGTRVLGVTQDKDTGDVYIRVTTDIGSPTAGSVLKYDHYGNLVSGWSVTGLNYGRGLAVRSGKVFISNPSSQTLRWYSTSNSSVWGSLSSGSDAMGAVDGLAFDSQGRLYAAAGATVKRWAANLSYLGIVINTENAIDVKIMPNDGGIRVMRWDGYLLGWDMDGNWTGPYYRHAPPPWPQALWIAPNGDYHRTAAISGGIQKLDTGSATWQTLYSERTGFIYPMGFTDFELVVPKLRVFVILEDYGGDPSLIRVKLDVLKNGSPVETKTFIPGTTQPIVDFVLDPGTYVVRASAGKWITREAEVVLPTGKVTVPVTLSLPNGDVDGDDQVGTVDFSIVSGNQGQAGN